MKPKELLQLANSMLQGLVHRAVAPSFLKKESNVKALRVRGWKECNYVLLDHPDVKTTTPKEATAAPVVDLTDAPAADAPSNTTVQAVVAPAVSETI